MTLMYSEPSHRRAVIEPLEARIAPALVLANPLADLIAGSGSKGATVDLSQMFDPTAAHPNHTIVTFVTNFIDPANPTAPPQARDIVIELFDDEAPLTVQNFLSYATNRNALGDYENVFFHRAAFNGATPFVLQGGGFDARNINAHIPVGFEVHNEFDASRSNLRGTVALAKTGLGPHTGTSEFFFNLGDNSANLDTQNGGFTVFARVIDGMDIVDKIAALPRVDLDGPGDGPLGTVPVQNYTAAAGLRPGNLIVIQDVQVSSEKGDAGGVAFNVLGVTDASGQPTNLVTARVVGTDLRLNYRPGANGVYSVQVEGTSGGLSAEDSFDVTIRPNLIANVVGDPFTGIVVPGERGVATVRIGNNGAAVLATTVDVRFFLSRIGGTDPNGVIFDESDLPVGEALGQRIAIGGGRSDTISARVSVPPELVSLGGETFRLIAKVEPSQPVTQLFTDDDAAIDGEGHRLFNAFGNLSAFGGRANTTLTYAEPDGDLVTLSLRGNGSGEVAIDGGDISLMLNGTDARSSLGAVASGPDGRIALHDLEILSPIAAVNLGAVDLSGHFTASGGARTITLGDLASDSTFSLGAFGVANNQAANITLGRVHDVRLDSLMPIRSLRATEWLDTRGDNDSITAPQVSSLLVAGDFEADLTITGRATLESFRVGGFVRDATVITNGNVGSVIVGGMDRSNFFAGVSARPAAVPDLADAGSIRSFQVTGVGGDTSDVFSDSQVAARAFGLIVVRGVDGDGGTGDFGFVADLVNRYARVGGATGRLLTAPADVDRTGDYLLRIL